MSRATVIINTGEDLAKTIRAYQGREGSERVADGIRYGLDMAHQILVGRVKRRRLNGQGPFPIADHKLGHRTRRLVRDFDTSRARIVDRNKIDVRISMGSNLPYFGAHEFGFAGKVNVKAHTRTGDVKVKAHLREVRIPERAMVRTELGSAESERVYVEQISEAVVDRLNA